MALRDKRLAGTDDNWWSLRPLVRPAVPADEIRTGSARPSTPSFSRNSTKRSCRPSPEADRRTLIRRLTFDLHGLPPTPEEVDEPFWPIRRRRLRACLIDRLLASPRYGERWGRHWLDVVHFGESHGYDKDKPRPNAWPYRDYVIAAFNSDKPYDRFVAEQLAGDVLFPDDPQAIVATGFIAAGPWDFVGHVELREGTVDKKIARSNDRDDMVATTMSTFHEPDGPLRPLPQPQVRPDSAGGLLPPAGGVRRRRSGRPPLRPRSRDRIVARRQLVDEKDSRWRPARKCWPRLRRRSPAPRSRSSTPN